VTIHRSHTDSMVRRPRPPPVTRRTPRPLTPTRCTETPAKAPAPDSLKLPPPYPAKLRQLKDQRTRQRPGAANHPPTDPALPPCLPQDTGLRAGPGRGRQDRRHQHHRPHQVGGQQHTPHRRYHDRLGTSTTALPPCAPQDINATDLPPPARSSSKHQQPPPTPPPASSCLAEATWAGITGRPERRNHPDPGDRTQDRGRPWATAMRDHPDPRPWRHRRPRPLAAQNMTCWTAQVVGCTWSSAASWRISAAG
jgi:hypothetical protein